MMLLLSALVLVLTSRVYARPVSTYILDPVAVLERDSRHVRPELEVDSRIAHLAHAINDAFCLDDTRRSDVVARSAASTEDEDSDMNVSWYISHHQSTNTYTLAFSSPTPEDLLELLASVPSSSEETHLAPLPTTILPSSSRNRAVGSIFTPYLPYLTTVEEATDALSSLLAQHRAPSYLFRVIRSFVSIFGYSPTPTIVGSSLAPEPNVEIAGHGLGAVLALLSSLRQSYQYPHVSVRGTSFSMPLVGDRQFAQSVDWMSSASHGRLELQRVVNGRDPIPLLPPPHFGLQNPSALEPRIVDGERSERSMSRMESGRQSPLDDSHGPYEGVMIGLEC